MVSISRNRALAAQSKPDKTKPEKPARAKKGKAGAAAKEPKLRKGPKGRYVLFVGDEGAILTYTHGLKVVRRLFAASPQPEASEGIRSLLALDPAAPIYLLLDSMDQSYQRQTLPPVAKMSLGKIIQRRLERDFLGDDIKGALEIGREESGRKDWNYLLVAVSAGETLRLWLDLLLDRDNPFAGFYLSPVTAEPLMRELGDPRGKKKAGEGAHWQMLISHHKVGGFRLVALREGRLVFTRLAQPIGETTPEVVAGNVEQEVASTIEYLKRLGYQDHEPLEVIAIVAADIKAKLDAAAMDVNATHFYTPFEASEKLKLKGVAQPEDHYADILFSVHMLRVKKHRLVLQSPATKKLATLLMARQALFIGGLLLGLGLGGYGLFNAGLGVMAQSELSRLEQQAKAAAAEYAQAQEILKKFPKNLDDMLDIAHLYKAYGGAATVFLETDLAHLHAVCEEMGFRTERVRWQAQVANGTGGAPAVASQSGNVLPPGITLRGELIKQRTTSLSTLRTRTNTLLVKMQTAFPDFEVTYLSLPDLLSEKAELKTTIGGDTEDASLRQLFDTPLMLELQFKPKEGVTR